MITLVRAALLAAVALLIALAPVAAHADLERSDPAEGDTVEGAPGVVSAVFSESLDPAASRLLLLDAAGEHLAEGGVHAEDTTGTSMSLEPPALSPGTYEVRWTARTPEDGGLTRGRWTFTVAAPTVTLPSAAPSSTPSPSPITPGEPGSDPFGAVAVPLLALAAVAAAAVVFLARRPR